MSIKLKDFILENIPEADKCEPKKRNKTEYCFTLEYENDSDFILKKSSPRSEKLLVVLVSQGQIYIKDIKANTIEKVTDLKQIRKFRQGMSDTPRFEKLQWKPFDAYHEYEHFKLLFRDLDTCKELMNRKLNPFKDELLFRQYRSNPEYFDKKYSNLKTVQLVSPDCKISKYDNLLENLANANITYNNVKDNLNIIRDMGETSFLVFFNNWHVDRIFNEYRCDFKAFLTWLVYTVKNRNRLSLEYSYGSKQFCVGDYMDYLRMQQQMYGRIKEKYPENWLTEEHILTAKYNDWKKIKDNQKFELNQEKLIEKAYENDYFKVVVPLVNTDILDEADQQKHCVASYVDSIVRGDTNIVFVREKHDLETALLTVEIRNNAICQVRGFQNRMYNKVEYDFLKEWADATGLHLGVASV